MDDRLSLIDEAFNNLEELKERFLSCERAYNAEYKDDNRTTNRKNSVRSRSRLYVPLIKTTIRIIHAIFKTSFMSDRCPIEILRVGYRSDNDLILQNALNAVLKQKWKNSEHRVGLSKAVLSALYLPLGITSLFFDKERSDIRTRFIPITDLAFDKYASDINDVEYVAYKWSQSKREVKEKFKSGYYNSKHKDEIIGINAKNSERVIMKDLYEKQYLGAKISWKLSSYANDFLVNERNFSRLPFHFGYCIDDMPSIDREIRNTQNGAYGSCIPEIVKELQEEYNIKRNQKIDITENQIDPLIAIDSQNGAVAVSDLVARKKFVRVNTGQGKNIADVIHVLGEPATYGLTEEINMLKSEYEIATGVNSVITGQTSPSDRRAMGALQTVNASSSMRIESMMQTLLETMLSSYAKHFIELIYKNISDDEFIKITENPAIIQNIGTLKERKNGNLDFDINVNFGTTIANEVRISQLSSVLGMMAQSGINSIQITSSVLKEILSLILGENAPIEIIDQAIEEQKQMQQMALAEQTAQQEQNNSQNSELESLVSGGI